MTDTTAARCMMGVETEYAFSGTTGAGVPVPRGEILSALMDAVRERCPHLPGYGGTGGVFLANGARVYIDCGHPEYATAECADPWTATRQIRGGERILTELAGSISPRWGSGTELSFFRFQVDYDNPGVTWGCHESYLHRSDRKALYPDLVPHLVSRLIYTGAGGFNPLSEGVEFSLSPRSALLQTEMSADSTGNRGILNTREESLSGGGWRRLHLICGEGVGSDVASVLRLGTTALVVAASEARAIPLNKVALSAPVEALHAFASDPACRTTARLRHGGAATALEIQWAYLQAIEECHDAGGLPAWAGSLCALWRETLTAIETDPTTLSAVLDWAMKKELMDRWLDRRLAESDLDREWIRRWSTVVDEARRHVRETRNERAELGPLFRQVEDPPKFTIDRARSQALRLGLVPDSLPLFLDMRRQLREIDVRFGELGRGIQDGMSRGGQAGHRLFEDTDLARAAEDWPTRGRAGARARAIGALSLRGREAGWAEWAQVIDLEGQRRLSLEDPWKEDPVWEPAPGLPDILLARSRSRSPRTPQ